VAVSFSRRATSRGRQRAATGPASPRSRACVAAGAGEGDEGASMAAVAAVMSGVICDSEGVTSATRLGAARGRAGEGCSSARARSNSGRDGVKEGLSSAAVSRCSATLRSTGRSRASVGRAASEGIVRARGRSWAGFSDDADREIWRRKSAERFFFSGSSASVSAGRSTARSSRDTVRPPKKNMWSARLAAAARARRRR
jgi:hypothetical protein